MGLEPESTTTQRHVTHTVEVNKGQVAEFGSSCRFLLQCASPCGKNNEVRSCQLAFAMYDSRTVQGALFGDPLIGTYQGSFPVQFDGIRVHQATLTRKVTHAYKSNKESLSNKFSNLPPIEYLEHDVSFGTIVFRYRFLEPGSVAKPMLEGLDGSQVAVVLAAFADLLSQSQGVAILIESLPDCVRESQRFNHDQFHPLLESWLTRLRNEAARVQGASTEMVLRQIGRALKSAEQLIAMCAPADVDGDAIHQLTSVWVWSAFLRSVGPAYMPNCLNQKKLLGLLQTVWPTASDPCWQLEDLGVQLPLSTPSVVVAAVATRLRESQDTEEDEVFTGDRIVVDGKVVPGLAVVVRGSQGSAMQHVFIYNLEAIKRWQQERGRDPNTRESLTLADILPLQPT